MYLLLFLVKGEAEEPSEENVKKKEDEKDEESMEKDLEVDRRVTIFEQGKERNSNSKERDSGRCGLSFYCYLRLLFFSTPQNSNHKLCHGRGKEEKDDLVNRVFSWIQKRKQKEDEKLDKEGSGKNSMRRRGKDRKDDFNEALMFWIRQKNN